MSVAHLTALFGLGCAANSLVSYLAAIHPVGAAIAKALYAILLLLFLGALLLDAAIYRYFRLDEISYYAIWAIALATVVIGAGAVWLAT